MFSSSTKFEHLAAEHLGDRRFDGVFLERRQRDRLAGRVVRRRIDARVDQARGPIDEAFERVGAHDHLAELVLDRAERRRSAGRTACAGPRSGPLRRSPLRAAAAHRAELEAREVEHVERDLVALADLAEQVLRRHLHVLQDDRRRRGAVQAHLVLLLAARHAGERALDEERGEVLAVHLTLAKTMNRSAKPPLVIHIFSPFSTKLPSACCAARVFAPSASEPDPGSLRQ